MKKVFLFCFISLFSLITSAAYGISEVGANITILPSSFYDGDVEWKAWTWVYNSGRNFGLPQSESNAYYNWVVGTPEPDAEGRESSDVIVPAFDKARSLMTQMAL